MKEDKIIEKTNKWWNTKGVVFHKWCSCIKEDDQFVYYHDPYNGVIYKIEKDLTPAH